MNKKCKRCGEMFEPEPCEGEEFNAQDKLCYHCFEDALEDFEEKKRERVARDNEY